MIFLSKYRFQISLFFKKKECKIYSITHRVPVNFQRRWFNFDLNNKSEKTRKKHRSEELHAHSLRSLSNFCDISAWNTGKYSVWKLDSYEYSWTWNDSHLISATPMSLFQALIRSYWHIKYIFEMFRRSSIVCFSHHRFPAHCCAQTRIHVIDVPQFNFYGIVKYLLLSSLSSLRVLLTYHHDYYVHDNIWRRQMWHIFPFKYACYIK